VFWKVDLFTLSGAHAKESCAHLGSLERANLSHWTRDSKYQTWTKSSNPVIQDSCL